MATLPFLNDIALRRPWFTPQQLVDMIAISESTPGPIGVNIATFAGYVSGGVMGGIIASLALIIPPMIILLFITSALDKFKENKYVKAAFYGLRPAVTALIAFAGYNIIIITLFDFSLLNNFNNIWEVFNVLSIVIFFLLLLFSNKIKVHPIFLICICAALGVIFKL